MNPRTFFEKVALMRKAQREYFKTRSKDALVKSKALESEIDKEISRARALGYEATVPGDSVAGQPQQQTLFD